MRKDRGSWQEQKRGEKGEGEEWPLRKRTFPSLNGDIAHQWPIPRLA